jgi:hypothetical protein
MFEAFWPIRFRMEQLSETCQGCPILPYSQQKTCIWIFCNEHTQSTLFDLKLLSCAFRHFCFQMEQLSETSPRCPFWPLSQQKICVWFFRNERTKFTLFDLKLMFRAFRYLRFRRNNCAKHARDARSCHFCNKKIAAEFFATNAPNPPCLT